jgi:16S rRNA G527 N7-methylase RsmG
VSAPTDAAIRSSVRSVVRALAPSIAPEVVEALVAYVQSLARFGAHTDLVGARSADGLAEIALGDALALLRHAELLRPPVWEIGAGGASLAIPIALANPSVAGVMYEPRQKRATFLRMALGAHHLAPRLRVEQSRLEPDRAPTGAAATALCRAVFPPDVWIPLASRLVGATGAFAVLTTEPLEPRADTRVLAEDHYRLPSSGAARVATWLAPR